MTRVILPKWIKELYGSVNKGRLAFRRWKGRVVLEIDPSPSYTRTTAQDKVRNLFKQAIQEWNKLTPEEKEQYDKLAQKYQLTGYQYFIGQYIAENYIPPTELQPLVEITITEQSGQDLTDFQVLLQVSNDPNFFSAVGTDPTKLEIRAEDKTTLLPFYVEEWDNNNYNAKIWIKIPSIPANGTKKVYLYSNPDRTTPLSDPEAVFDFYDDFNDLSKWTEVKDGNSYIAVNNGLLEIHNDGSNRAYARSNQQFNAPYVLEVKAKMVYSMQVEIHWDGVFSEKSDAIYNGYDCPIFAKWRSPTYLQITKWVNGTPTVLSDYQYSLNTEWHIYKILAKTNGIEVYLDGSKILETGDTTFTSGYIGLSGVELDSGIVAYYDWVRIRKYASPEPSVSYTILT